MLLYLISKFNNAPINNLINNVPSLNGKNHYNTNAIINIVSHLIIIFLRFPFISMPLEKRYPLIYLILFIHNECNIHPIKIYLISMFCLINFIPRRFSRAWNCKKVTKKCIRSNTMPCKI